MELKHMLSIQKNVKESLLIVPYGIETLNLSKKVYDMLLLIVPYGIET